MGSEFQVNTYVTGDQRDPEVAATPDGRFVVAWDSLGSSGTDQDSSSVHAQRYAADGSPLGVELQVNTQTSGGQLRPSVAMADSGDFVVVWATDVTTPGYPPGWELSVQGQRLASDGSPLGSQFKVNTVSLFPLDIEIYPSVAAAADGSFIVVWASGVNIFGRRYASDGTAQGAQFQINTHATGVQSFLDVDAAPNGDFVVVWTSNGSPGTDTSGLSVQGRRFASDGSALGAQFQINTYTTSHQSSPNVAVAANGDLFVVWTSDGSFGTDADAQSAQGQRYAADGSALGGQFQINTFTAGAQVFPKVSAAPNGDFVVVWESSSSPGPDTSNYSVWGKRFAANGSVRGMEFQVNTHASGFQRISEVAAAGPFDFVAVWQSDGSAGTDTNGTSIQSQRLSVAGLEVVPALSPSATLVLAATLMGVAAALLARRARPGARSEFEAR